jgi:hypothetical protein
MKSILSTLLLAFVFTFAACTGTTDAPSMTLEDQVGALVAELKFEEAIKVIKSADMNEPSVKALLAKTHLDYGIHIEYNDNTIPTMRDKMVGALYQYIEVLKLQPDNEKAIAEIDQIIGIYQTMPGRTLPADILEELRARGMDGGIEADE